LAVPEKRAITFEYGGPRIYFYEDFLRAGAREAGLEVRLVPMPPSVWDALALVGPMLPNPPLPPHPNRLMQVDNVASLDMPGFAELGISPRPLETILREMLTTGGP